MQKNDTSSLSSVGDNLSGQYGQPDMLNNPVPSDQNRMPATDLESLGKSLSESKPQGQPQVQVDQLGGQLQTTAPSGELIQGNVQTYSQDELKSFKDRFVLNLARTLREKTGYLENKFGKDNVKVDEKGIVYFRRNPKEPFIPVDKQGNDIIGGLSIQDVIDILPDVGEVAFQTAIEGSSVAGGAALGGMVAGPAGAGVGAMLGLGAGLAAAPAASIKYKESLLKDFGVQLDPSQTFLSQWVPQASMNAMMTGAGAIAGHIAEGVGGLISKIGESGSSLAKVAAIKQTIKDIMDGFGHSGSSSSDIAKSIMSKEGRLAKEVDTSAEKLSVMKEEAQKALNYAPVDPTGALTNMRDVLSKNGIKFKPDGSAMRPGEVFTLPNGQVLTQDANRDYFGMQNGSRYANDLAGRYNDWLSKYKSGGVQFEELDDALQSFGKAAVYEGIPPSARIDEAYKTIRKGMQQDRNNYIVTASANPQPGTSLTTEELNGLREHVQSVFDDYSNKKSIYDTFVNRYNMALSDEKFNRSVIKAYDPQDLSGLKSILGEDSQEWKNLVGDYFKSVMDNATNPRSGILEPEKMLKEFVGLTKEKREILGFDDRFIGNLRTQANKFRESYISKIDKKAESPLTVVDLVNAVLAGPLKAAELKYEVVGRLLQNDARLADYMMNDGFLELSKKAVDRQEAIDFAKKVREGMSAGVYKLTPGAKTFATASSASKIAESALGSEKTTKESQDIKSASPEKTIRSYTNPLNLTNQ